MTHVMIEPDWAGALCAEVDPDLWFPESGGAGREARAICGGCELRAECLEWALYVGYEHGIWGGLGSNERTRERRRRDTAQRHADRHAQRTSKRTAAVAELTDAGWSATEIAAHLNLTARTVVRYRARLNPTQHNQKVAA